MVKILTSGFNDGFTKEFKETISLYIKSHMNFAFICSEFNGMHEKNHWYCNYFLQMFSESGIIFNNINVIDSRITANVAKDIVKNADVLWLAGGDTPTQFKYLESYNLIPVIKAHRGVIIGMSAGSINMTRNAVCSVACGHTELKIYEALGLVEFSVEPHLDKNNISDELLEISEKYPLYGICDDGAIICTDENVSYIGDVFLIKDRQSKRVR